MKREELRQEFEIACEIKWENSQGEPDIDYVMWLEDKITATQPSLPPAEGAEEILEDIAMRIDASGVGNNRDAIKRFYRDKLNTLATLHAQRIADKMVSERCKKCKYRGLPDSINEALNSGDGIYRP